MADIAAHERSTRMTLIAILVISLALISFYTILNLWAAADSMDTDLSSMSLLELYRADIADS